MMSFDDVIFMLEMIGTVAFAISGVMVAKDRKMDIFGAIVLGCATAVGGGMIRDLILGEIPPAMFTKPVYVTVAFITCVVDFIFERSRTTETYMDKIDRNRIRSNFILNVADSVGLAAFVVVGCRTAVNAGYGANMFLACFVGVLTGIGGGILRDIFAGQMPLIMRKRVYGIAAIVGAIVYCGLSVIARPAGAFGSTMIAAVVSMIVTVLLRFLAIYFHWNLPSFK